MIIGIDFDGTCVKHEFPKVGGYIGAEPVIEALIDAGHQLILFTMRSDNQEHPDVLQDAVNWFAERSFPLFGINENPQQKEWTESPKPYCHHYIDDASIGVPLIKPPGERPYVDWVEVAKILCKRGILTEQVNFPPTNDFCSFHEIEDMGYLQRQDFYEMQKQLGKTQKQCAICGKWLFPIEFNNELDDR